MTLLQFFAEARQRKAVLDAAEVSRVRKHFGKTREKRSYSEWASLVTALLSVRPS
jgi:hypothetical protein